MKRSSLLIFSILMCLLLAHPVSAGDRPVITIGDNVNRSGSRYDEERGVWRYLEDLLDVDIRYVYMTNEEYCGSESPSL